MICLAPNCKWENEKDWPEACRIIAETIEREAAQLKTSELTTPPVVKPEQREGTGDGDSADTAPPARLAGSKIADGGRVDDSVPVRDKVFISYSHKDKRQLNELLTHLKPYLRDGSVTAWSDQQIVPGSKWFAEINAAIAAAKVAVLLVTPDFLASDFIHEHELGPLLKEAEVGGVRIVWVPVRACSYKKTVLKDYQAVIDPVNPLVNLRAKADRDKVWVGICEEIEKAVGH
jgi:hypothetical protein